MRKNLLLIFAVAFILASMILPLGTIPKAYAVDGNDVLQANTYDYCSVGVWCGPAQGLQLTETDIDGTTSSYSDAAALQMQMTFKQGSAQPATDKNNDGKVDWGDFENTAWDSIYSPSDFSGSSADNGVFIQIGTQKDLQSGNVVDYKVSGDVQFDVKNLSGVSWALRTKSSDPAKNSARALLKVLVDQPNRIFGQMSFNPTFLVDGLQANKTYYARILVEEDGSDDYFWSNIVEFKTKPAGTGTTLAEKGVTATTQNAADATPQSSPSDFTASLKCKWNDWSISGCMVILFNDIFVSASQWLAQTTGRLFDAFAAISLGSKIYGGPGISDFIVTSWAVVRDISNIFFIFILLYTALGLVLSLHHFDAKKLIAKVIIMGLLINFSLFFCRVAIDTSNILSRVFYNAMNISQTGNDPVTQGGDVTEQSMSAAIVGGVQPQKLFSKESYDKLTSTPGMTVSNGTIFIVLLMAFILNMALAWIFFMCAAFFAGRIGVIWFSMIFAPLAFVSSIVPELSSKLKQLGWSTWLGTFMKACFNAPIFFFFMYLIVNLVGGGSSGGVLGSVISASTSATGQGSFVVFLVGIMLPTMILIGLLMEAKNVAQDMAGEFGAAFAGVVAAGTGLAAMAVTGGAAIAGRATLGAASARLASPDSKMGNKLRSIATGNATSGFGSTGLGKWAARQGVKATDAGKKSNFDVRNTGIANSLSKATGVDMNIGAKIPLAGGLVSSLSTEKTAGGYEGKVNRQAEKDRKFSESLGFDKQKHDEIGKEIENREDQISKQEDIVEAYRELVQQAKADKQNGGSGTIIYKDPKTGAQMMGNQSQLQLDTNAAQGALRTMKKGTSEKWTAADIGKKKLDGTNVTQEDVTKGAAKVVSLKDLGVEKLKKVQENTKTARAKEYLNNRITKSGKVIHEKEKRDAIGNITKFAHAETKTDFKQWGKNMARDLATGVATGAVGGGLVAGPVGALAGGIGFGLAKVIRSGLEDGLGGMRHDVAHLAADNTHQIHKASSSYKSPASPFTDLFKSVGGGNSGGGDHGGGGHDDHGGGGHH